MSSNPKSPLFHILSREQKVLLAIYSKGKDGFHMSGLARQFRGKISKVTLLKTLEKLEDMKLIEANWRKIKTKSRGFEKGVWVRSLRISPEATQYVKQLHEMSASF